MNGNNNKKSVFGFLVRFVVSNAIRLVVAAVVGTLVDPITGLTLAASI